MLKKSSSRGWDGPVSPLCLRHTRPRKDGERAARCPFCSQNAHDRNGSFDASSKGQPWPLSFGRSGKNLKTFAWARLCWGHCLTLHYSSLGGYCSRNKVYSSAYRKLFVEAQGQDPISSHTAPALRETVSAGTCGDCPVSDDRPMFLRFIIILVLSIVCLAAPTWADVQAGRFQVPSATGE
jgi:hypothetical protein